MNQRQAINRNGSPAIITMPVRLFMSAKRIHYVFHYPATWTQYLAFPPFFFVMPGLPWYKHLLLLDMPWCAIVIIICSLAYVLRKQFCKEIEDQEYAKENV